MIISFTFHAWLHMESLNIFGTRIMTGDAFALPTPDSDNSVLLGDNGITPAEWMQWAKRRKKRICRDLAADPRLWTCPELWRDWNATIGIEKLLLWQCWGIRDVS
jgi:hypothetical protein